MTMLYLIRFAKQVLYYHAKRLSLATVWPFYAFHIHTLAATTSRLNGLHVTIFMEQRLILRIPFAALFRSFPECIGCFRTANADFRLAIESEHTLQLYSLLGKFLCEKHLKSECWNVRIISESLYSVFGEKSLVWCPAYQWLFLFP